MSTFGEKLKAERERRNTPLSDVAARTRIGIQYLEALEHDDFDELPGPRGFGKLYIRAYAEMLGFDPAPLIREYDDVVHRRLREAGEDEGTPTRPRLRRIRYVPPPRNASNGGTSTAGSESEHDDPELPELDDFDEVVAPADQRLEIAKAAAAPPVEPIEVAPEPEPDATTLPAGEPARRNWLIGAVAGALLFVVTLAVLFLGGSDPVGDSPAVAAPLANEPAATAEIESSREQAIVESDAAAATVVAERPPDPPPQPATSRLSVTSAGVGTGVSKLRLTGEATTFRSGDVVSFLTRVEGGVAGQRIRHVWTCEGRTIQSIPLTLGGGNWRTYTNKTVLGTGAWAVEARAGDGSVLARSEFDVHR